MSFETNCTFPIYVSVLGRCRTINYRARMWKRWLCSDSNADSNALNWRAYRTAKVGKYNAKLRKRAISH